NHRRRSVEVVIGRSATGNFREVLAPVVPLLALLHAFTMELFVAVFSRRGCSSYPRRRFADGLKVRGPIP
ncbi:MAG: hypothetical protein AB8G99_03765, partial [Planctomycetaceae bacterium]